MPSHSGTTLWATPRAQIGGCQSLDGEMKESTRRIAVTRLENQAKYWPTPAARDAKGAAGPNHLVNGTGRKHLDQLPNFVSYCSRRDLMISAPGEKSSPKTRRLNPRFVELLMGWPPDWSRIDCEFVGMASSPWPSLMRSQFWRLLTSLETKLRAERQGFLF